MTYRYITENPIGHAQALPRNITWYRISIELDNIIGITRKGIARKAYPWTYPYGGPIIGNAVFHQGRRLACCIAINPILTVIGNGIAFTGTAYYRI
jgi:hypothetical protein